MIMNGFNVYKYLGIRWRVQRKIEKALNKYPDHWLAFDDKGNITKATYAPIVETTNE